MAPCSRCGAIAARRALAVASPVSWASYPSMPLPRLRTRFDIHAWYDRIKASSQPKFKAGKVLKDAVN